jgi:dienelactone hydrolase
MQIGEQVLLPAVRDTPADVIVIADGFSCRQQIKDGADRWAMHPAEVIAMAIESKQALPAVVPERRYLEPAAKPSKIAIAAAATVAIAAGLAVWRAVERPSRR